MIALIIALVVIIVLASLGSYTFSKSNIDNLIRESFFQCPVGYCSTSLTTGVKRCSSFANDRVIYDPAVEVCNPIELCTDPRTPNAELGDGSTNPTGQCSQQGASGIVNPCRCLAFPKCPAYVSNHFEYSTVTESSLTDIVATKISIVQGNTGARNVGDTTDVFSCTISGASLANVITAPNCNNLVTNDDYIKCISTNACPDGVMAVVVDGPVEVESFDMTGSSWNISNLSCIKGYDTDSSGVLLKTECVRAMPSQSWWSGMVGENPRPGHCAPSKYPTPQQWQSYLSGDIGSWSSQCIADIESIWNPVYDKSTHTMYCKNT